MFRFEQDNNSEIHAVRGVSRALKEHREDIYNVHHAV